MAAMSYEYAPLRLPAHVDRVTATAQLTVQAEFAGWELANVRVYPDGSRHLVLRRPRTGQAGPGLSY
jgi:hypothetical protein